MSTDAVAVLGFVALFGLMLLRVPVGMAMGLVGVSGFGYLVGGTPALKLVGQTSMRTVTDYTFGVIPMFLLMGTLVSNSGMSRELFRAANGFVGHLRGGLGIATVAACGGFAAICGSSVATAATFSAVAYPEMRRFGYPQSFATGVIAAGGTLGAMLPPSTVLAVYGIILVCILLVIPKGALTNVAGFTDAYAHVSSVLGGSAGWVSDVIAVLVVLALLVSGTAWIVGSDRVQAVAALDGAAPAWMGKFTSFGTPIAVNIMSGIVGSIFVILGFTLLTLLFVYKDGDGVAKNAESLAIRLFGPVAERYGRFSLSAVRATVNGLVFVGSYSDTSISCPRPLPATSRS